MLISTWNFLRGYVMIEVSGFSVERFLNLAVHRGIYIWNIERKGNKTNMSVGIKGYRMLKLCARKTGCKMKIKRKVGLPFITYSYRKRVMIPIGIIVFIVLIYTMASFVWLIEVEGNEKVTSQEIVEKLDENGYKIGRLKYKMNLRQAEQIMMNDFSEILWTGISFEGTKLIVEITEAVPEPLFIDYRSPTHIVAKADALILDLVTRKGTPMVKKGDTVRKGDILVSGVVPIGEEEGEKITYARASADITAKTHYLIKAQLKMKKINKEYTGIVEKGYSIRIFDKKLKVFQPEIKFEHYDQVTKSSQFQVTSKFPLPFYWIGEEYIDYILKPAIITDEVAQDKLLVMLDKLLKKTIHEKGEILTNHVKFDKKDGIMLGTLQAIVKEELGEEVLIQEMLIPEEDGRN